METLKLLSCFFSSSSHLERLKLKKLEIAGGGFVPRSIDAYLGSVLCNPSYLEKLTLIDSLLATISSMDHFPHLTTKCPQSFSCGRLLRFLAVIHSDYFPLVY
jgi:hypothetical protein